MDGQDEDRGTVDYLPANLPGTELLVATRSCRRWVVLHHTYTVCTVMHIDEPVSWRYRGRVDSLGSDSVSFMEPGEVHANLQVSAPATFRVLFIDPVVVANAAAELGVSGTVHFDVSQVSATSHPNLRHSLLALHRALEQPEATLETESRFTSCLRLLFEQCTETRVSSATDVAVRPEERAVRRARDYLDDHLATPVTLRELTEASGAASQFQLIRLFTTTVGLPPHAYQIQRRITRGRSLLASGLPPVRVALETGFADQSHFTRHFSRVVGVSPATYARAVREPPRVGALPRTRRHVQDVRLLDRQAS